MAFLRPFSDIDVLHSVKDTPVKEGEEYKVAKEMFDSDETIKYFYYFNDYAHYGNHFYTHPITRGDVEFAIKYHMFGL